MLLKRVCGGQADKFLVKEGSEGQPTLICQRVILRHDENETVGCEGARLQVSEVNDIGHDSELNEPFGQRPDDLIA